MIKFLGAYFEKVEVEMQIIGKPIQKDGKPSNVEEKIKKFIKNIKTNFPEIKLIVMMKDIPQKLQRISSRNLK